jgi:hypothetical protein
LYCPKKIHNNKNNLKMANHLSVYVYRRNQYDLTNPNGTAATSGVLFSLPTANLQVQPSSVVANGVQMNSLILIYPSGLNQPAEKLYSDATVAGLIAAINGGGIQTTTTTTAAPTTTTTTAAPTTTTTTAAPTTTTTTAA